MQGTDDQSWSGSSVGKYWELEKRDLKATLAVADPNA
jgi:hypothetical protein